jgi:hypothetical protein
MVSNTLKMRLEDLLATLERLRRESGQDPEYQELRRELPADWPM